MSKPRVSLYLRLHDLIASGTSSSTAPDALDEVRVQVVRAFSEALYLTAPDDDEDDDAPLDPGTVDTTDLPPL